MPDRRSVLLVTDSPTKRGGRRYCDEDIFLASRLRNDFDIALCHPLDAVALMDAFDVVVVRNSGPVLHYRKEYDTFREQATARGTLVYNPLSGRGDMAGKQYLLDLTTAGYPVIPTIDHAGDLHLLPEAGQYAVKPKTGADSIGLAFVPREQLGGLAYGDVLVQPRIDFRYEVSFYYVDDAFQYALHAPDPEQRWLLEPYEPTWPFPGASSTGTPSATASSAWTPAARGKADCSSSSWRTSTRTCPWTWYPTGPVAPSWRA